MILKKRSNSLVFIVTVFICLVISSAQAKSLEEYRNIFDTIDNRINNGNGYKESDNLNNKLGWTESRIMMAYAEMYYNTKDNYYLDKLSDHIDHVLTNRDDHCGYKDFKGESKAGWSSEKNNASGVGNRRTVQDGMIIYPMIQFVEIVYDNPTLLSYKNKAGHYLSEVEKVVADHQKNWVEGPDTQKVDLYNEDNKNIVFTIDIKADEGYYRWPLDTPYRESWKHPLLAKPHNRMLSLGCCFIKLHKLTGKAKYLDMATRMGIIFKRDLELVNNNAYQWHYSWGPMIPNLHDSYEKITGHGAIDIRFAQLAYDAGIVFDEKDIKRFTKTFTTLIYQGSLTEVAGKVDGKDVTTDEKELKAVGEWIDFAEFDKNVYTVIKDIFQKNDFENDDSRSSLLGFAKIMKWAIRYEDSQVGISDKAIGNKNSVKSPLFSSVACNEKIAINYSGTEKAQVKLFNLSGRLLSKLDFSKASNKNISLKGFRKGMYIISLKSVAGLKVQKVLYQ